MKKFIWALALCFAAIAGGNAEADEILYSTDFDVADGPINTQLGWTSHSGTENDLLVTGGQAVVQHGMPSEDSHIVFASQSTGVLRAEFDITVNDDTQITSGDEEYFAHFMADGTFTFRGRVDVVAGSTGGDYSLGVATDGGTADATLSSDFTFGEVVGVTLELDLDTGTSSLTVGGETIAGASIGGLTMDSFALRQSDSNNNETVTVDNLVVTAVMAIPEPTSAMIFGLAGLGVCVVRRRS